MKQLTDGVLLARDNAAMTDDDIDADRAILSSTIIEYARISIVTEVISLAGTNNANNSRQWQPRFLKHKRAELRG